MLLKRFPFSDLDFDAFVFRHFEFGSDFDFERESILLVGGGRFFGIHGSESNNIHGLIAGHFGESRLLEHLGDVFHNIVFIFCLDQGDRRLAFTEAGNLSLFGSFFGSIVESFGNRILRELDFCFAGAGFRFLPVELDSFEQ